MPHRVLILDLFCCGWYIYTQRETHYYLYSQSIKLFSRNWIFDEIDYAEPDGTPLPLTVLVTFSDIAEVLKFLILCCTEVLSLDFLHVSISISCPCLSLNSYRDFLWFVTVEYLQTDANYFGCFLKYIFVQLDTLSCSLYFPFKCSHSF